VLGLGLCRLSDHADKDDPRQPCFEGVQRATQDCTAEELAEVLGMLGEMGLLSSLLQGGEGGAPTTAADAAALLTQPPASRDPGGPRLSSFGKPFQELLAQLCAKLKGLKPGGLAGLLPKGGMRGPGGCVFAIAGDGLAGAGGGIGARVTQCLQKHRLEPEAMSPVAVRFPTAKCGVGRPSGGKYHFRPDRVRRSKKSLMKEADAWMDIASRAHKLFKKSEGKTKEYYKSVIASAEASSMTASSGKVPDVVRTTDAGDGYVVADLGDGSKWLLDRKTRKVWQLEKAKPVPEPEAETDADSGDESMPVEPGSGDCGETAAMARARAIFNCIFGDTEAGAGATPGPQVRPQGPSGPRAPEGCDEVSMAAIWGSSTGPSVTDPTDPEDLAPAAGPNIYQSFVPKIHGAIDPVESDRRRATEP